ncbi:MAG: hypothetical protein ACHQD8_02935 [Chitinophagales bacterium]
MRNIRFSIVTASILFAGSMIAKAQTADEIIQKHITAIGGADNWKKITSIKMTGSINAGGAELPISFITVNGKGWRMEFSINGMSNYTILTTKEGWAYFPIQGQTKPEAMTADDVKESQDQLDIQGPLIDYQAKGNKVTYLGKDDMEGTECHKIKVAYPNGKEETMYIDASNYYHIRSVEKTKSNGKEEEQTQNFGNFQKIPEGIVYPMSIEGGGMGRMEIKTVEINKPVDESIFKPEIKK